MRGWLAVLVLVLSLVAGDARAATVEISGDWGGFLVTYEAKWKKLAAEGGSVRISGPCVSACTVVAGFIPRKNICVTPTGSLGFHKGIPDFITPTLWKDYPADIQSWIAEKGGLTDQLIWLQAPEIYKFFRRCDLPGTTAAVPPRGR